MENDVVQLTQEEIQTLKQYQRVIDQSKVDLGNMRRQYLVSENRMVSAIVQAENDFLSHLKVLASGKDIAVGDGGWIFDPSTFVFRKKE